MITVRNKKRIEEDDEFRGYKDREGKKKKEASFVIVQITCEWLQLINAIIDFDKSHNLNPVQKENRNIWSNYR